MKKYQFPEFYIRGKSGYFNINLMTSDGYRCYGFSESRRIHTWNTEKTAKKWLKIALTIDPEAVLVDNSI